MKTTDAASISTQFVPFIMKCAVLQRQWSSCSALFCFKTHFLILVSTLNAHKCVFSVYQACWCAVTPSLHISLQWNTEAFYWSYSQNGPLCVKPLPACTENRGSSARSPRQYLIFNLTVFSLCVSVHQISQYSMTNMLYNTRCLCKSKTNSWNDLFNVLWYYDRQPGVIDADRQSVLINQTHFSVYIWRCYHITYHRPWQSIEYLLKYIRRMSAYVQRVRALSTGCGSVGCFITCW